MRIALPIIVALLVTATAARAEECQQASPEVTLETPAGTFYVDNDDCQMDGCLFSLWIYQESNGREGLQRGDQDCVLDHTCCDADTIVF